MTDETSTTCLTVDRDELQAAIKLLKNLTPLPRYEEQLRCGSIEHLKKVLETSFGEAMESPIQKEVTQFCGMPLIVDDQLSENEVAFADKNGQIIPPIYRI